MQTTGVTLSRRQCVSIRIPSRPKGCVVESRRAWSTSVVWPQFYGLCDCLASVGIFEHVGHVGRGRTLHNFRQLHRLLYPGDLVLQHAIAAGEFDHEQLDAGLGDFIEKHIFPSGELVHAAVTVEGLARSDLELLDAENLRPHYARTLWAQSEALDDEASVPAS